MNENTRISATASSWFTRQQTCRMATSSNNENENEASNIIKTMTQKLKDKIMTSPTRSAYFSLWMALCGAILGPFLDSYHSAFGVLRYDEPIRFVTLPLLGGSVEHPALTTAWWVPELFGFAGFLIGWLYILLDEVLETEEGKTRPEPPFILAGIAFFTFQYWLSGILYELGSFDRSSILFTMTTLSAIGYVGFDSSKAGFWTSLATAIGGPLIEVGLISSLSGHGGYHYTDLGETGFFPLWICPVYFLGGPANGNLARGIWNGLTSTTGEKISNEKEQTLDGPKCTVCNDTRAVGCPNCDSLGYYVSYNRKVKCNCCKGRGLVICRNCFSEYGDDPYDIEGIRDIMGRMPD